MKKFSLVSLMLMAGMLLFIGGCQREDVLEDNSAQNKVSNRLVQNAVVPSNVLNDINAKWYQTPSKSRAFIYNSYGDINYDGALSFTDENDLNIQGYSVPFEKDGNVTAIMFYINDEQSDFNLFDFVTLDELLNLSLSRLDDFYKKGYLKLVLNQFILHQHYKNGWVSKALLNNLSQLDGLRSNKNGNRCSTIYSVEVTSSIISETYDNTIAGDTHGGVLTADGVSTEIEFIITVIGCHPSANLGQTGVGINFPIISNNNNGTEPGAGSNITNSELQECIEKKVSPIVAGLMDEMVEGYIFPCIDGTKNDYTKALKGKLIKAWCTESKDDKKMTGIDILDGLMNELSQVKYLTQNDINYLNTLIDPCTGEPVEEAMICAKMCENDEVGANSFQNALDGVNYVTQQELDEYTEIFNILGITSQVDKLKFLSGSDCGSDGGGKCKNCSVGEAGIVFLDHERAKEMLKCAIAKLKTFDGASPENIFYSMQNHLVNNPNQNFTNYLIKTFQWILFNTSTTEYQMQDPNYGNCEGAIAWTYPLLINDIYLCGNTYLNKNPIDRSETLIHEMMHVYFLRADLAYSHQTQKYFNLTDTQRLFNADSYSNFIKDICGQ